MCVLHCVIKCQCHVQLNELTTPQRDTCVITLRNLASAMSVLCHYPYGIFHAAKEIEWKLEKRMARKKEAMYGDVLASSFQSAESQMH